jgi:hypothetical protein
MAQTGEPYTAARLALDAEATLAPRAQLERYVELGYPALAGMRDDAFRAWLEPLVHDDIEDAYDETTGRIGSLLVIRQRVVSADAALPLVTVNGAHGFVDMQPSLPQAFNETDAAATPDADAYVLTDFDPGDEYRNQPPSAVLTRLLERGRTPLTIDEAIAALVLHPQLLRHRHAFSILGSRSTAPKVGQSVPAVWISRGAPRLGWCWNNNPHTWLGSASCAIRHAPRTE